MRTNELARVWRSGDKKHVLPCFILQMLIIRLCNHCFFKKMLFSLYLLTRIELFPPGSGWEQSSDPAPRPFGDVHYSIFCVKGWSVCWVWRQHYHNLLAGLRGKIPEFVPIAVQIQLINYRAEHCTTVAEHSPGPKANLDNGEFGWHEKPKLSIFMCSFVLNNHREGCGCTILK